MKIKTSQSILIYYFSGTGNTARVTDMIASEFEKSGTKVRKLSIEDPQALDLDLSKYTKIGLGYPVHAFNAPEFVFDFVEKLYILDEKPCFVYKTSGDPLMNGGSTHLIREALRNQGLNVFYERLFIMPANVAIEFEPSLIKQLVLLAKRTAKLVADEILSGTERLQKNGWFNRVSSKIFSKLETSGVKWLGKRFKILQSCTFCGLCEKICPTKNIEIQDDKITHSDKCMLCMRCVYTCPEDAIKIKYADFFRIKKMDFSQQAFDNFLHDPEIKPDFLNSKTRGIFKHYYKFFKNSEDYSDLLIGKSKG